MLEKIGDILKRVSDALLEDNPKPESSKDDTPDILTAEKLAQLKWLSASQLANIYKYGKVKTKIADDATAYAQLKWFNSAQLKAIFGDVEV